MEHAKGSRSTDSNHKKMMCELRLRLSDLMAKEDLMALDPPETSERASGCRGDAALMNAKSEISRLRAIIGDLQ